MKEKEFLLKDAYEQKIKVNDTLADRVLIRIGPVTDHTYMPYHYHDYIEIIYSFEGKHKAWIGGTIHEFSAGDLVFINSGEVHGFIYSKGKTACLQFNPEIIYNSTKNEVGLKYILPFIVDGSKNANVFRKEELENSGIPELIIKINKECSEKRYGYEFAAQIMISEMYLWFMRFWQSHRADTAYNESAEIKGKWLKKVFAYVDENYNRPITALEMAVMCNMSYSYFSRCFKRIMHKTFSEYLTYVRINEAEKLLLTTDMNITEIGDSVGFSDSSYFIKQFKSYKSISPKQYRKNFET